jgi:phosphoglycerate dehydrogenase-like enzyme
MKIVINARMRPLVEGKLPPTLQPHYVDSPEEAAATIGDAEAAWLDFFPLSSTTAIEAGTRLRWLSTLYAGIDALPVKTIRARGTQLTNGAGLNAVPCAEYAVMGVLSLAKNLPEVIRAGDRHQWSLATPGTGELLDSHALILGYGAMGRAVGERLRGFGVIVTGVRRTPGDEAGVIGPDDWRARLSEFDWIILTAPSTSETQHMIGEEELAAMKSGAFIVNVARGTLIDQNALIAAVRGGRLAGAWLDVTTPEPLPADHPLWDVPGITISMHLSGRSQTRTTERAATLFLDNAARFAEGQPLRNLVDLSLGY